MSAKLTKRSSSKIIYLKNDLRVTISNEWITGLSIVSTEEELIKALNLKNVVQDFATNYVSKVNFKLVISH